MKENDNLIPYLNLPTFVFKKYDSRTVRYLHISTCIRYWFFLKLILSIKTNETAKGPNNWQETLFTNKSINTCWIKLFCPKVPHEQLLNCWLVMDRVGYYQRLEWFVLFAWCLLSYLISNILFKVCKCSFLCPLNDWYVGNSDYTR